MDEQGGLTLSLAESIRVAADTLIDAMLTKRLEPTEAARYLERIADEAPVDQAHLFDPFVYALSEIEDRPRDRDFFVAAIVAAAEAWTKKRK